MITEINVNYTFLNRAHESLSIADPLQRKALQVHLSSLNENQLQIIEDLLQIILKFLEKTYKISVEKCVACYSKMCKEILFEQLKFSKTGKYSADCAKHVREKLYSSSREMSEYIFGLGLSVLFWPNHFKIYEFFIKLLQSQHNISNYLEIGPGHGLFLYQAILKLQNTQFDAVDISQASTDISSAFMSYSFPDKKISFTVSDINDYIGKKYDFITIGEVLEHVDNPKAILIKIRELLSENGCCFLSTCANCPAVDHVYLFHDAADIRSHIEASGLRVINEMALLVNTSSSLMFESKPGLNYAALVVKDNG